MSHEENRNRAQESTSWVNLILRVILSAIVIAVAAFLTPGFSIRGIWAILLAAVVISLLDYLVQKVVGVEASPFGRGLTGFIIAAVILYVTQFIIPTMRVTLLGAILGALVIGIIDAVIPGKTF